MKRREVQERKSGMGSMELKAAFLPGPRAQRAVEGRDAEW